jgi:hypothetical protein
MGGLANVLGAGGAMRRRDAAGRKAGRWQGRELRNGSRRSVRRFEGSLFRFSRRYRKERAEEAVMMGGVFQASRRWETARILD